MGDFPTALLNFTLRNKKSGTYRNVNGCADDDDDDRPIEQTQRPRRERQKTPTIAFRAAAAAFLRAGIGAGGREGGRPISVIGRRRKKVSYSRHAIQNLLCMPTETRSENVLKEGVIKAALSPPPSVPRPPSQSPTHVLTKQIFMTAPLLHA